MKADLTSTAMCGSIVRRLPDVAGLPPAWDCVLCTGPSLLRRRIVCPVAPSFGELMQDLYHAGDAWTSIPFPKPFNHV